MAAVVVSPPLNFPPSAGATVSLSHFSTLRVCDFTVSPHFYRIIGWHFIAAVFHRHEIIDQRNHFKPYPSTSRGRRDIILDCMIPIFLPSQENNGWTHE
jgi:hypothetical protein